MTRTKKAVLLILLALVLAGLLAAYVAVAMHYQDRFLKHTTIAGEDVGDMTYEEAAALFDNKAASYEMTLSFREDDTEKISGEDIDFHYENEQDLRSALRRQNPYRWPMILFGGAEYDISTACDEKLLKKRLKKLPELKKENMEKPVDAHPEYQEKGFVVMPEVMGTTIFSFSDVYDAVKDAVLESKDTFDCEEFYENPNVYEDDEILNEQIENLNKLLSATVTYELPDGGTKVLDGSTMIDWLEKSEDGEYSRDDEKWSSSINEYVVKLGEELNTVEKPHKFKTNSGKVVELPGLGYYGWKVNQEEEAAQLGKDLDSGKDVVREPVYQKREAASPKDNYGYGDTYVEVNLSAQKLWVYKKGEEVFSTPVVSGKNTKERRTPAGAFFAYDKQRNKDLVGADYVSHVNYWIRLTNGGVGIHDATWRSSFGGGIWYSSGSHGCINVPLSAAKELYSIIDDHMPVAVYY